MRATGQVTDVIGGPGSIDQLAAVLDGLSPRRILAVASRTGLAAADLVRRTDRYEVRYFTDFTPNPQLADVVRGCAMVDTFRPDLIIGVGGGSAMDVAKMVRALPSDLTAAESALTRDLAVRGHPPPLVLIPTTAGTGAEVTRFAAVYIGPVKHSFDHPLAHPDVAVVDPGLTASCPRDLTYSCALDAFAHALESTWAVRSTPHSRALAGDALRALIPVLRSAAWPVSAETRWTLSAAALRAGLAIDITRTTAGHAFAYPLTARFGVRHGVACALNLRWLVPYTAVHLTGACADPRGPAFVRRRLDELIDLLGAGSAAEAGEVIASFLTGAGFAERLGAYGIRESDLPWLVATATGSQRATNAPIRITEPGVLPWLQRAL